SSYGLFVTQTTSPSSSPNALDSIALTVTETKFDAHVYAATIPLLGEWGFVLGARDSLTDLRAPNKATNKMLAQATYLDRAELDQLWTTPPALAASAEENTLAHQPLVELLAEER